MGTSSLKQIKGWVVKVGVFYPYLCRVPGAYIKGGDWLAPFAGDGGMLKAFLMLQIPNAIVIGSIVLAVGSYRHLKSASFPILFGFAALTFGYCTNDLTPESTAGLGVAFISLQALPAVLAGWLIGRNYDRKGIKNKNDYDVSDASDHAKDKSIKQAAANSNKKERIDKNRGDKTLDFDLTKTSLIAELFSVENEKRDEAWRDDFLDAVRYASLAAPDPQTFTGPDGMIYFRLFIPEHGKKFTSFSINHLLEPCTEEGHCGIAIYSSATAEEPEWIFSLGDLWSYRMFGSPKGDPVDLQEIKDSSPAEKRDFRVVTTVSKNTKFYIGAPSEDYLPYHQAKYIGDYMRKISIAEPMVALIMMEDWKPRLNLMFNISQEKLSSDEFDYVMQNIAWILPRSRGLMGYDKEFAHTMQKLP